ncbi:MAG: phage tail sheath subtilisin-like domain-containing protein [Bacteroidota bacterium]
MAVQTSYPGVYVQEVPSGVRTITGVSTSIAVFIGRSSKGTLNTPLLCFSYSDFSRNFSADYDKSDLARSVKLFFLNGGTVCYVMRIANGATSSGITLKNSAMVGVLTFTAKSPGIFGDDIRINITYGGPQPEATFNAEIFRWDSNNPGQPVKADTEYWPGLSMDPAHPRYAADFLTRNSKLVNAADLYTPKPPAIPTVPPAGYTLSGRPLINSSAGAFRTDLGAILTAGACFRISVNGGPFIPIDLSSILPLTGAPGAIASNIQILLTNALPGGTVVNVDFVAGPLLPAPTLQFKISSPAGDVYIEPSPVKDLAKALMLGSAQGGVEVPRYADARPAPNGIVLKLSDILTFADYAQTAFNTLTIDGVPISLTGSYALTTGGSYMYQDGTTPAPSITGNNNGILEKLNIIAQAINHEKANNPKLKWSARIWGSRLAILADSGEDNYAALLTTSGGGGTDFGANFEQRNVRYYSLGATGKGFFQGTGIAGIDGNPPLLSDYSAAYDVLDKEVDLFNLMILPKDSGISAADTTNLWGPASVYCQQRRAFLLIDPPETWTTAQQATDPSVGVNSQRIGLVKDHSAVFYPRLTLNENGRSVQTGPSGAIAGLMARIDASRGVWKAPAGTEADLRGINGLEYKFSDQENGQLNPHAVNTIRIFPNGIVNWGARTMDGDDGFQSEYKYIPIRRTALFIEESLYRGLKWVVFEPNDEPLWGQIRLNVGAFMHNLFRQGAFQGKTKQDAYFVKCDSETTTQNDIDLGIVNIWVGFAPLKPAEFVVLYLQQMSGQIQV